jgi:hypothetical protein
MARWLFASSVAAVLAAGAAEAVKVFPSYRQLVSTAGWEELPKASVNSPGGNLVRHLDMNQTGLPLIRRMYVVHVPDAYLALDAPGGNHLSFPVVWYFHGQGMNPLLSMSETDYNEVADANDWFTVFPKGLGRSEDGGVEGTGWNVGVAGTDSANETCTREAWSPFGCNCTSCYDSCQTLGYCSSIEPAKENRCGWSTCYDDVAFAKVRASFARRW